MSPTTKHVRGNVFVNYDDSRVDFVIDNGAGKILRFAPGRDEADDADEALALNKRAERREREAKKAAQELIALRRQQK